MKIRMPYGKLLANVGLRAVLLFALASATIMAAVFTKMFGGDEMTQGFVMGFVVFCMPDIISWLAARS